MHKKEGDEYDNSRRKLIVLAIIFIAIFAFGTIGYALSKSVGFDEAFMLTLSTLGFSHQEPGGAPKLISIALLAFGMIFVWFTIWASLDIMLEGHFHKHFKEARFMDTIKKLSNHFIICGGGRVGMHIAEMLQKRKEKYVIVEKDPYNVMSAIKSHFVALEGDALEENVLKEVNIDRAKALIAVLPETEKNILIVLSAKELNSSLKIYARSNREEYVNKLKNAGADYIFMPELSCAEEIIKKIDKNII